jgi:hypothetical protein
MLASKQPGTRSGNDPRAYIYTSRDSEEHGKDTLLSKGRTCVNVYTQRKFNRVVPMTSFVDFMNGNDVGYRKGLSRTEPLNSPADTPNYWIKIWNKDVNVNHAARNWLATAANDRSDTQCLWDYGLAYKSELLCLMA